MIDIAYNITVTALASGLDASYSKHKLITLEECAQFVLYWHGLGAQFVHSESYQRL